MDQCSARHPISATGDPANRPGHDLQLGIDPHSRFSECSPASGSVISLPRQGPKSRQRRADRFPLGSRRRLHLITVATCGFRCCLTPLADGSVSRTASFPTTSATWQPSDPGDLAQCDCGAIGTEKMSIKIESRW